MALLAGSYEKFIWGFALKSQSESHTLKPLFSFPSHLGPIKSVAVAGPVAASGAADDTIKVYDLSANTEIGSLLQHSGAVTALSFFTPAYLSFPRNLLSGSDDGTVAIYDADPFVHLKTVPAHKRGVIDLCIHPSGKLALSVGRDSCLAMLNLVRGRRSFCCRLDEEASIVNFDLDGERFFMATEEKVTVHKSEDARIVCEMNCQKRVLCTSQAENNLLFTGGEDRGITAWDTLTGKVSYCIENAHSTRVKGLVAFGGRRAGDASEDSYLIASASSDGVIRVWDMRMVHKEKPNSLAEANTKSRITCLAGSSLKSSQRPLIGNTARKGESEDV
ncbi:hypothetical protein H6P81_019526 [Aristolochia fimbriata]|uniref:P21-activated protein kinase-interacting protein 1-like n=1 Tax=Aristolochia fimbriata TaxID=158543 RepID=A0AAV7DV19_ARIFI|nr:hypothetical protein H6P81_019526 [Aristolochia fimbriata]